MRYMIGGVLSMTEDAFYQTVDLVGAKLDAVSPRDQVLMAREADESFDKYLKALVYDSEGGDADVNDLPFPVVGGTAIVQAIGTITHRPNCMQMIYGGCSSLQLQYTLLHCLADDRIKNVIIEMDSYGGEVNGLPEVGNAIERVRAAGKDVVAFVNTNSCSAMYYIACHCSKVVLSGQMSFVGSIGVVRGIADRSGQPALDGVKVYKVATGPNKAIGMFFSPVTEANLKSIEKEVMSAGEHFAGVVSKKLGKPFKLGEGVADGSVWRGQEAIDLGLADSIMPRDQLVAKMSGLGAGEVLSLDSTATPKPESIPEEDKTTPDTDEANSSEGDSMNKEALKALWATLGGGTKPAPGNSAEDAVKPLLAGFAEAMTAAGFTAPETLDAASLAAFTDHLKGLTALANDGREASANAVRAYATEANRLIGPGTVTDAEIEAKIAACAGTPLSTLLGETEKFRAAADTKFTPSTALPPAGDDDKAKAEAKAKEDADIDAKLDAAGL